MDISSSDNLASVRTGAVRIDQLLADSDELTERYRTATPWPHLVLDGYVDPEFVAAAEKQALEQSRTMRAHTSHRQVKAESAVVAGPAAQTILDDLLTPEFVGFLETVTGVEGLVGDPTHKWGGLHAYRPGAFQAIHADFELHPATGLFHRVNVLIYLNEDWPEEYGGQLELWPPDMSALGKRVDPIGGRIIIFETDAQSLHGLPEVIACPEGRARVSLVSYYYSEHPATGPLQRRRFLRPRRPQDPWYFALPGPSDLLSAIGARRLERTLAKRWK